MWCNFTFVRVKLTYFKNDYDYDDDDKFKKLDPLRAELAGKKQQQKSVKSIFQLQKKRKKIMKFLWPIYVIE